MSEQEEVEEHLHHAKEPFDKLVAGTMAAIAALLAIVSVLGQHFATEKLVEQQLSSDQWAFYQAKNIRQYAAGSTASILMQLKADPGAIAKYAADRERYGKEMESIKEEAESLAKESKTAGERAEAFHLGEIFLEIGIVFSSLSILTKRRIFFIGGGVSSLVGLVLAAKAYLVR